MDRRVLLFLAFTLALSACSHGGGGAEPRTVTVSAARCASGWSPQPAGAQRFTVRNDGSTTLRVTFLDAETGGIYGQILQLAAHTTRPLAFTVPAGRYRWRCAPLRGTASVSPVEKVRGKGGKDAKPLMPLGPDEINAAMDTYRRAVNRGLARLVADTDRLRSAVLAGDVDAARERWLTAHLDYERLGAAYGTFGHLDTEINGRPDGLPGGVADPGFTGFLRLEYGLWHRQPAARLHAVASRLDAAVHRLARRFPHMQLVASDLPLRAHEILENTLQFELTGGTDQGSHTNLATARANVEGTRMVLAALATPLRNRNARLFATAESGLSRLAGVLDRCRKPDGGWRGVGELTRAQRERLNALVGALLERLALIPDVLQMPPSTAPS